MHDKAALEGVLAPALVLQGLELIRFTMSGSPRQPSITVYVDRVGGVTMGECVEAAKALRHAVAEHFGPGRPFTLSVSSPGADRPLRTPRDFALILGRRISARIQAENGDSEQEIIGVVLRAEPEGIVVGHDEGGAEHRIPYSAIRVATMQLPYGQRRTSGSRAQ